MWFIGVEVEEETSAPPPKKNPGSAPVTYCKTRYERYHFVKDEESNILQYTICGRMAS